jgi:membrane associated rhomboid family serine protease
MDWSLVLVSQGIESTIDHSDDGAGWGVLVPTADHEPALNALRQYEVENRGWPWRRKILHENFVFDWGSLAWTCLLALFYWFSEIQPGLRAAGMMDSAAVAQGEWWRLFTAVWLHADLAHLAANATLGGILLGLAMGRFGTGMGLWAAYLAGVGGNVSAWLAASEPHYSLGASGMVMGSLGLLATQSLSSWRETPQARKFIVAGILGGVMLFTLLGLNPDSDVMAHFGGFASGLLLGGALACFPDFAKKPGFDLLSGLAFALWVILPWWLALRP